MLPNSPQVKTVIEGKDGILEGMKQGTVIVDMSSIDPTVSIELEKEVAEAGGELIDAPVSGGEPKAVDGTLSFMCGGKPEVFDLSLIHIYTAFCLWPEAGRGSRDLEKILCGGYDSQA